MVLNQFCEFVTDSKLYLSESNQSKKKKLNINIEGSLSNNGNAIYESFLLRLFIVLTVLKHKRYIRYMQRFNLTDEYCVHQIPEYH